MTRRGVPLLFLLLVLLWPTAAVARDAGSTRSELEAVQKKIRATEQQLRQRREQARRLVVQLHKTDARLGRIRQALARGQRRLAELEREIGSQQKAVEQAERARNRTAQKLKKRLIALYKGGETQFFKVLFSARSPATMAEDYDFFRRMVHRDRELLATYRQQRQQAERELQRLESLSGEQKRILADRRRQEKELTASRREKQRLLARIRQDEEALAVLLHELEEKARRLTDLVRELERGERRRGGVAGTSFRNQKGRLPWPVRGPIRVGFGTGRHPVLGTRYESHGIEIVVNGEKPIRAVWDGRVIFAKPFRGYGNLMIIDHGDGFYTLYAQASRLLHKPGDRVERGEKIAISGFEGSDVVYFEIRQGSKPIDPLDWLAGRR
ncbi:septal ring factor EnvC (AmiA/AmiB activator) [Geothermobacter ehrlichii]|uniref:Septal ring factor EnvC (AmiA/AmiB activator) n=1 Tax=Geothermobacter ehrlichii TaxID=213224 RepID=A0A5D3WN41_9BACT|nr:peptidoglycan DD-metalloendopeptidase family protein [Geothermobacter ehrlichii]TYO98745.1 septal ring factor EnvC (AmiA/AmiB activator) [Geothermobacter ehrlichii]